MEIEDLVGELKNVRLIIFSGLPGVGKTFIAKKVAKKLNAEHLRTDVIRQELFPVRTYSREESGRTYEEFLHRAEQLLRRGRAVILDATFLYTPGRKKVYSLAKRLSVPFKAIYVTASEETVRRRLEPGRGKREFSEAGFGIYLQMKRNLEEKKNYYSLPMEDEDAETIVFENEN